MVATLGYLLTILCVFPPSGLQEAITDSGSVVAGPTEPGELAAAELVELHSMLEHWAESPGWPHHEAPQGSHVLSAVIAGDPCPELSVRLAGFAKKFGQPYAECSAWPELAALADRVHERLIREFPAPGSDALPVGSAWISPGWLGVRALLLELSGRTGAARQLLFGDGQRSWSGCCLPCLSEDLFYLSRSRAEFLDRSGESEAASLWYLEALHWCVADDLATMFDRPRLGADLAMGRLMDLLAKQGDHEASSAVWRTLARADAKAAETSQEQHLAPAGVGALQLDSGPTLFAISLDEADGPFPERTALVLGDIAYPLGWRVLAARVPLSSSPTLGRRHPPRCDVDFELLAPGDARVGLPLMAMLAQRRGAVAGSAHLWSRGDLPPALPGFRFLRVNEQGCPEYERQLTDDVTMVFVLVPAGVYEVGGSFEEFPGRYGCTALRQVSIDAFLLAQTECTQRQWQAVMNNNPSRFYRSGSEAPVDSVSWHDIRVFARRTRLLLPSSTQWEVAARAGGVLAGSQGLGGVAWFGANSGGSTHGVRRKAPNGFGLFDMIGNVREWCEDSAFGAGVEVGDPPTDGSPWLVAGSALRSLRGGGWFSPAYACDARIRDAFMASARNPNVGFRPMYPLLR